jgi:ABC-2 type transport system ATP-binding protein
MTRILTTTGLTKHYGRLTAVDHLDLEIEKGQVFGILGPNGSGKTTTLAMLLGALKITSGSYSWFEQGDHFSLRKRVGAILEHPIFYPFLSATDNLKVTAHIKDVSNPDYDGMLQMVGLFDRKGDVYRTYSLGMKQRLAIAAAMIADPEVLIFDEPTNGLDPQGIADIRRLIQDISGMGKTIILASHLLDEVQKVCSHFCVLQRGKKIYQGSIEDVMNQKQRIEVNADDVPALVDALERFDLAQAVERKNGVLVIQGRTLTTEALNAYLFKNGITASHLVMVKSNLEEQFLEILKENDH